MKTTILYQRTKGNKKIQQWKIWVVEKGESGYPEVWTEHGQVEGKKQTTFDVIKGGVNEGKANATTPLKQAELIMERKITKQKEKGYSESKEGGEQATDIDWSKPMPEPLRFYKPKNSVEDSKLEELEKEGRAVFTVKRDGMNHPVRATSDFGIEILSRTMDVCSDKYPHLVEALKSLPAKTILLGEIILDTGGKDNFNVISKICRSDTAEAQAKQNKYGKVKYYVYDLAFYQGKNLLTTTKFKDRRELMLKLVKGLNSKYVLPSEVISQPHEKALKEVVNRGLEGLVVFDSDGIMKDGVAFSMSGKAERPNGVFKRKPLLESDFIVRWDPDNNQGDYGKGKNKDVVGNVFLYQLLDGQEVFLGKCGGGLSDEQRKFYTTASYPRVWRVEFSSVQPKTGKLRFPVFNADRTLAGDKGVEECDMDPRIKAAREQEPEEDEAEE
jgi:ATP-dependent DNA ligase